jgi:hypothetical protein
MQRRNEEKVMIFPSTTLLQLIVWVAKRLGLELEIPDIGAFDALDEHEVIEQLHYGRD